MKEIDAAKREVDRVRELLATDPTNFDYACRLVLAVEDLRQACVKE